MADRKYLSPKQRRQRNREEMIESIVQAARHIMREQGVAALNLNEIARVLGMRTPSLYEYFPGKMALYDYLFLVGTRHFRTHLQQTVRRDGLSIWERTQNYLAAHLEWAIENPDLFKLLFERHVPGFEPSEQSMAEMYSALEEATQELDESLRAAHLDLGIPVEQARDILIAVQHGITALHLANSPQLPIGQGRFSILIPLVINMLRTAWEKHSD